MVLTTWTPASRGHVCTVGAAGMAPLFGQRDGIRVPANAYRKLAAPTAVADVQGVLASSPPT